MPAPSALSVLPVIAGLEFSTFDIGFLLVGLVLSGLVYIAAILAVSAVAALAAGWLVLTAVRALRARHRRRRPAPVV